MPGYDAHTHLDFPTFANDRDMVLTRAKEAGVRGWAIAAADPRHWDRVRHVAREVGAAYGIGVHPWWADTTSDETLEQWLCDLGAIAPGHFIGETGLDTVRCASEAGWDRQVRSLCAHLALAEQHNRPVALHSVRATHHLLQYLPRRLRGLVHAWTDKPVHVEPILARGLHVSVGPAVLTHRNTQEAVRVVPADRLLLETDCPDWPLDGVERGEPADLVRVAEAVASIRGDTAKAWLDRCGDNARALLEGP